MNYEYSNLQPAVSIEQKCLTKPQYPERKVSRSCGFVKCLSWLARALFWSRYSSVLRHLSVSVIPSPVRGTKTILTEYSGRAYLSG
jgi:hypothetical protein